MTAAGWEERRTNSQEQLWGLSRDKALESSFGIIIKRRMPPIFSPLNVCSGVPPLGQALTKARHIRNAFPKELKYYSTSHVSPMGSGIPRTPWPALLHLSDVYVRNDGRYERYPTIRDEGAPIHRMLDVFIARDTMREATKHRQTSGLQ